MVKSDKSNEIKALKKALKQEQRKNKTLEEKYNDVKLQNKILKCESKKKARELLLSSLSEKERQLIELLFPDTDTTR
ncbi:MAG: hypothetical protein IKH01_04455 [Prevotella sp.]|nr:hypothetical protein [Prevotella sp.]